MDQFHNEEQRQYIADLFSQMRLHDSPNLAQIISQSTFILYNTFFSKVLWRNYKFPTTILNEVRSLCYINAVDVIHIVVYAVLISYFRSLFIKYICQPFCRHMHIGERSPLCMRMRDSMFKSLLYLLTWLVCLYCVLKYQLLSNNRMMWEGWTSDGMIVPTSIRFLLLFEAAYYLHSFFATMYMEVKMADHHLLLAHHVIAMTLITCAYALRFHNCAVVVLFIHDINDVFIDGSKVLSFLQRRDGKAHPVLDAFSRIGMICVFVSWVITRLYTFVYKVLYSTLVVAPLMLYGKHAGCYYPLNSMLFFVFLLDVFWFLLICKMLVRMLTGKMKKVQDIRDDFVPSDKVQRLNGFTNQTQKSSKQD